jgi:hypothetical protein
MIHLLASFAALLLAAHIAVAAAAPQVPSSALPGRERERFMESPVERFMRPAPQQPPLIELPGRPECGVRPGSAKRRSARRRTC